MRGSGLGKKNCYISFKECSYFGRSSGWCESWWSRCCSCWTPTSASSSCSPSWSCCCSLSGWLVLLVNCCCLTLLKLVTLYCSSSLLCSRYCAAVLVQQPTLLLPFTLMLEVNSSCLFLLSLMELLININLILSVKRNILLARQPVSFHLLFIFLLSWQLTSAPCCCWWTATSTPFHYYSFHKSLLTQMSTQQHKHSQIWTGHW